MQIINLGVAMTLQDFYEVPERLRDEIELIHQASDRVQREEAEKKPKK